MKKITLDLDDWITLSEAARIRNTTRQAISKLAQRGRLETIRIAGHIFVNKSSVIFFVEETPGRKPKKRESNA